MLDSCIEFFDEVNRKTSLERVVELLEKCWDKSPIDTLKLIFHLRDCRGGKGLKDKFYECIHWVMFYYPQVIPQIIEYIPLYGSYKDLLKIFSGSQFESLMISFYCQRLIEDIKILNDNTNKISLAAKWAPSEGGIFDKKYNLVQKFCQMIGEIISTKITKSIYRKQYLIPLREKINIVETQMCSGQWDDIDFSEISTISLNKYRKSFLRHCPQKDLDLHIDSYKIFIDSFEKVSQSPRYDFIMIPQQETF
jgi:hypothetical protein